MFDTVGVANAGEEAFDRRAVGRRAGDATDVKAKQIGGSELEVVAQPLVEASIAVVIDIDGKEVCEILEVAFSLKRPIGVGHHLEDGEYRRRRDERRAVVGERVRLGVREGQAHSREAHDLSSGPGNRPCLEQLGACW